MQNDPEWRYAPMLVTSNIERAAIIEQKAILFAKDKGEVVFRWKLDANILKGEGNDEDLDKVIDCSGLWAYFVKGASLYLTNNLNPNKYIANGTSGIYHSLIFDDEVMNDYIYELEMNTSVGEIITLSDPPDYIIVKLKREMDIESNLRIENDSTLIPISRVDCKYPVSYKLWLKSKILSNNPVNVQVKDKSGVQMAFAYTFHKAVGQTIPRLIPCLSKRPQYMFQLTYRLLLVALSRV